MADTNLGLGNQLPQEIGHGSDRLHPVVHEVNLSTTAQLTQDGVTDQIIIKTGDIGPDCLSIHRWSIDNRQLSQAGHALVQGPRNRCGGQGQDIDLGTHLLQTFLVGHAKALFLINDDQTQVFKMHITLQQAMRADHDINLPGSRALNSPFLFRRGTKTRQHINGHRVIGKPLPESLQVLTGQNCRRHQDGHLATVEDRFKSRPDRNLGLAVADIATDQTIDRTFRDHVREDSFDRLQLVRGFFVGESRFEFTKKPIRRTVAETFSELPASLNLQQVTGHLLDRRPSPQLGFFPGAAAHLVQSRRGAIRQVLLHLLNTFNRQVKAILSGILEMDKIPLDRTGL